MGNRNSEVIAELEDLLNLTVLDEGGPQSFRVRAYENAVRELGEVHEDLEAMSESQLTKIDGVGKSTAKKIREYFESGTIAKLEKLREKYPPEFVELTRIPGLGPKSLLFLRDELGIDTMDKLREAVANQEIRGLKGFGAKSEEKIAQALERVGSAGKNQRRPLAAVIPLAGSLVARLEAMDNVECATYCGSLRRFRETVADIDIVAASAASEAVFDAFLDDQTFTEVLVRGDTKCSVLTGDGLQVDLRIVGREQYGAAILYFTGSKAHNIKLRQRALAYGWTLNEYALSDISDGSVVASASELEIYKALEMDYIPPPMREDHGEVEASVEGALPQILGGDGRIDILEDLRQVELAAGAPAQEAFGTPGTHIVVPTPDDERDWHGLARLSADSPIAIGVDVDVAALYPPADALRAIRDKGALFVLLWGGASTRSPEEGRADAIAHCQRAWLPSEAIVNTWDKKRLAAWRKARSRE